MPASASCWLSHAPTAASSATARLRAAAPCLPPRLIPASCLVTRAASATSSDVTSVSACQSTSGMHLHGET